VRIWLDESMIWLTFEVAMVTSLSKSSLVILNSKVQSSSRKAFELEIKVLIMRTSIVTIDFNLNLQRLKNPHSVVGLVIGERECFLFLS